MIAADDILKPLAIHYCQITKGTGIYILMAAIVQRKPGFCNKYWRSKSNFYVSFTLHQLSFNQKLTLKFKTDFTKTDCVAASYAE